MLPMPRQVREDVDVVIYEELGHEVCADPIRDETVSNNCAECRVVMALGFKMIYTRRIDRQK